MKYADIEIKYGPAVAYQCLIEIEKASRIPLRDASNIDPEIRLANAFRIQDEMMAA